MTKHFSKACTWIKSPKYQFLRNIFFMFSVLLWTFHSNLWFKIEIFCSSWLGLLHYNERRNAHAKNLYFKNSANNRLLIFVFFQMQFDFILTLNLKHKNNHLEYTFNWFSLRNIILHISFIIVSSLNSFILVYTIHRS